MTIRSHEQEPDDLERRLGRLRADLIFPTTPDIASAFTLEAISVSVAPPGRSALRSLWPALVGLAIVLAVLAVAVPGTRSTVAGWFDFGGIRIEIGTDDRTPQSPPTTIGGHLFLGRQVSIEDAATIAPFAIVAPADRRTAGTPESYLLQRDGGMIVSLLYPPTTDLPEVGTTGVGLLLMQIDSPDTTDLLAKRSTNGRPPVSVAVNGEAGAWIVGGTLTIEPVYESGAFERSSGNVLIWEANGVTYRMESSLGLADALAIAGSLQPVTQVNAVGQ